MLAVLRFGQLTSSWKFATASSQAVLLLRESLLAKNCIFLDLHQVCPTDLLMKNSDHLMFPNGILDGLVWDSTIIFITRGLNRPRLPWKVESLWKSEPEPGFESDSFSHRQTTREVGMRILCVIKELIRDLRYFGIIVG